MDQLDEEDGAEWGEPADEGLAEDALPVCPECLAPCGPLDYYCLHCGSNEPLRPVASYMPFVDLWFRFGMVGKLWRTTWQQDTPPAKRALYLALFFVCMPAFLVVGMPFVIYEMTKKGNGERLEQREDE